MKILISGGSGYLGRALSEYLLNDYQQNVSRETDKKLTITWLSRSENTQTPNSVYLLTYRQLTTTEETFDIIINLAGTGIIKPIL